MDKDYFEKKQQQIHKITNLVRSLQNLKTLGKLFFLGKKTYRKSLIFFFLKKKFKQKKHQALFNRFENELKKRRLNVLEKVDCITYLVNLCYIRERTSIRAHISVALVISYTHTQNYVLKIHEPLIPKCRRLLKCIRIRACVSRNIK